MTQTDNRILQLEKMIEDLSAKKPHSEPIVTAFRPVIIEKNRMMESLQLKPVDTKNLNRAKINEGVPVIKQIALFEDVPLEDIALSMIPALKAGFQALREDLERLQTALYTESINLPDFFKTYPEGGETILINWSKTWNMQSEILPVLLRTVTWIVLHRRAKEITQYLDKSNWQKGYCPVCGSLPSISLIQEKGGERRLHCFHCGHNWRFSRVLCPCCEYGGQKETTFFFIEGNRQEAAYTCDQCKKYLLTLTQVSDDVMEINCDVAALGLIHLDMIMQDRGYTPMTDCDWNHL
jgi:FdhE protein